jgi:hypothetical protein
LASAVRAAAPTVELMGPGTWQDPATNPFAASFAHDEASQITLLTNHYYRGYQDRTPHCTLDNLLHPDPTLVPRLQALAMAVSANHIKYGYRLGETNSCNQHGVPGLSDALVSALWGIEYMFVNATYGSTGVNFHGGEVGMNGSAPFVYSPIGEANGMVTGAKPLFYGMLFMSRAGTGDLLAAKASAGNLNLSAYAVAQADGSMNVALLNKEAMTGVTAAVDVGGPVAAASAIYLQGPALDATTGVTLAGASISQAGAFSPNPPYALASSGNTFTVVVPPASAALVHVR